ncbi:MAG: TrkH family potassium uptake protein [Ruminococcaceae bacterium]|nr:TrkH family potassium uptake protein [Oscillospiraceae bacterium]
MKKENSVFSDYVAILGSLTYVLILLGIIMMLPLAVITFHKEEAALAPCFIYPGVLSIFSGYLLKLLTAGYSISRLKRNGGAVVVLLIWIVSILIGSIPFIMQGDYTFTEAVFETTSGFTTTGFTVTIPEEAPKSILFYRSVLHLFGGVGLVLFLSLVLSNIYGMQLFSAEGHNDRLAPSVQNSAKTIFAIYLGFIVGGTTLYTIFGMPLFDAINHSISAVATGGFSTKSDSIGYWHSVPIDITTIILMCLGSFNFMASLLFIKGQFKKFFLHCETRVTIFLLATVTPITTVMLLTTKICPNVLSAIDNALFQVTSILTTTGLSTINDFLPRAEYALLPLLLLMIVGGHSNSTAGGIKAFRTSLLVRSIFYDLREQLESNRIVRSRKINRFGKDEKITQIEQSKNYTYVILFLLTGLLGSIGLMLCGYSFRDSIIEFFSALGTVGMSIGIATPTSEMSNATMWIITAGMLVARLEIYIFFNATARILLDFKELTKKRRSAVK